MRPEWIREFWGSWLEIADQPEARLNGMRLYGASLGYEYVGMAGFIGVCISHAQLKTE